MRAPTSTTADPLDRRRAEAVRALEANRQWYHTIELAPGVATPGHIDLRQTAPKVLPDDLSGKRALDVGSFDGFWAFELERRGADVVAIDTETIDANEWPPLNRPRLEREAKELGVELGRGFKLAAAALDSRVRRQVCDIYDLSPERIGGPVGFAFSGDILLHLRDPVRALEHIHASLEPGGELRVLEPFSVRLSAVAPRRPAAHFQASGGNFNWWVANLAGLRDWLVAAGFVDVRRLGLHRPAAVQAMRQWHVALAARRPLGDR